MGKWGEMIGIMCDKSIHTGLRVAVYKTVIRAVLVYGSETWTRRKDEQDLLERRHGNEGNKGEREDQDRINKRRCSKHE